MVCPTCSKALITIRQREGVFYFCPDCSGRCVTIPQLRRVCGDTFGSKLLRLIKYSQLPGKLSCPFCHQQMWMVLSQSPPSELEACRPCALVWFNRQQYQEVPEGAAETTNSLSLLATDILAAIRLKELKEQQAKEEEEAARKKKSLRAAFGTLWNSRNDKS